MPLTVACTQCGKTYAVPEASVGKRARCKACGHVFVVPTRPRAVPRGGMSMPRRSAGGAPTLEPTPTSPANGGQYQLRDEVEQADWSRLEEAAAAAAQTSAGPAVVAAPQLAWGPAATLGHAYDRFGPVGRWVRRQHGEDQIFFALIILGVGVTLISLVAPGISLAALFAFLIALRD